MNTGKHFLIVGALVVSALAAILLPAVVYADDRLDPGDVLKAGNQLTSRNHRYRLVLQKDGNLVLYDDRRHALWASNTRGQKVEKCVMQRDGNLVLYHYNGRPIWATNTADKPGAFLSVQNDGNLVIYEPRGVWASNTAQ